MQQRQNAQTSSSPTTTAAVEMEVPQRVALLAGGAFNPPTRMHFEMFTLARAHLEAINAADDDVGDGAAINKNADDVVSINEECGCAAKLPDASAVFADNGEKVEEKCGERSASGVADADASGSKSNIDAASTTTNSKILVRRYRVVEGILSPVADAFGKATLIPAAHRLRMCELGAARFDWIRVDGAECARDYWTKTLAMLKYHQAELNARAELEAKATEQEQQQPPPRLMMLCGADIVASFTKLLVDEAEIKRFGRLTLWDPCEVAEIAERFGIVVIERGDDETTTVRDALAQMHLSADALRNIHIVEPSAANDECNTTAAAAASHLISSTRVRELVRRGEWATIAADELVYPEVAAYIAANRLYLDETDDIDALATK